MDPLEQAEEFLKATEQQLLAEQLDVHSQMILLSSVMNKPLVQGNLLFKAQDQGADYITGLLVAVGLTARKWGRVLGDDASIDFTQYINPAAEVFCATEDGYAHYLVKAILDIETTGQANTVREEIKKYLADNTAATWDRMTVHMIGIFGELVTAVLDIRNGDYVPGPGEDVSDIDGSNR